MSLLTPEELLGMEASPTTVSTRQSIRMQSGTVLIATSSTLRMNAQTSPVALRRPAFQISISHIIGIRPGKKMRRIHARADIAPMANEHPVGDFPIRKLVAYAMRADEFITNTKEPIAVVEPRLLPKPTRAVQIGIRCWHPEAPVQKSSETEAITIISEEHPKTYKTGGT